LGIFICLFLRIIVGSGNYLKNVHYTFFSIIRKGTKKVKGTPKNYSVMLNLFQYPLVKCTMQGIAGQARNDELNF